MALQLQYTLPTGDTGNYWRVDECEKRRKAGGVSFNLYLYKSKEASEDKAQQASFSCTLVGEDNPLNNEADKQSGFDIETLIYNKLKTLSDGDNLPADFSTAIDA